MNQELQDQDQKQISPITGQPTRKYEMREDRRTCTAHSKNGLPCRKIAILGGTVCRNHGGNAPLVKEAARIRMEMAADKMVKVLLKMAGVDMDDPNVTPAVKLKAALAVLDRAGLAPKNAVDVTVGPRAGWEELLDGISQLEGGSRAESRAARGVPDDPPRQHDVVDAEVVDEQPECEGCGLVWGGRPLPNCSTPTQNSARAAALSGGSLGRAGTGVRTRLPPTTPSCASPRRQRDALALPQRERRAQGS